MPVSFGFLLVRLFPMYVVVLATEALRLANKYAGRRVFDWQILSEDGHAVEASNGIAVDCDAALRDAPELAYGFIVAGDDQARTATPQMRRWLVRAGGKGTVLGAIDSGVFLLAEARLIRERNVTVHPVAAAAFREQFPEVNVQERPIVVDGSLITCAGGMATVELLLMLIERHCNAAIARDVASDMVSSNAAFPPLGRLTTDTLDGDHGASLEKILEIMRRSVETPLPLHALARHVGFSERQFARVFHRATGEAPMAYYRKLRLNHAKQLLFQSDMAVSEIAFASGFRSISAFSRCFTAEFGRSPRKLLAELRASGNVQAVPARNFTKRVRLHRSQPKK
ncbi:GlxA family transcriptional regulator [Mesorhizobium sp. STM 4661]|uniref:GlxA family transcriptional regulator n=1 Tax=Mesorhizobium sp. STM 4661 TaxID=1297570 RepID=UPI0002BFB453|nr:GlxA family transcriptional regulator [Mesorhizobium sp. STM 4661]CCV15901.1 putative HTH-type transcriptional regulator glxA [Mesorhizobium sp. STM 4661]